MAGKGQGEGAGTSCTVGDVGNPPLLSWRQRFHCRARLEERHHLKWLSRLCPVLYFLLKWMGLNVPGLCWCLTYQDGSKTMFWLRGTPGLLRIQVSILYDTTDQLSCYTQGGPTRDGAQTEPWRNKRILWRKLLIWGTTWTVSQSYALWFVLLWAINSVSHRA